MFICSHVSVVYVLVLQVPETKLIMFICSHVGVVYVLVLQVPETKQLYQNIYDTNMATNEHNKFCF
jgi:hypothetical protein